MAAMGLVDHVVRPHVAQVEDAYLNGRNVAGTTETYIPSQLPSGINRIVSGVLSLFEARQMRDHCEAMPLLAKDVVWDAPPFLLSRKGGVRVSSYLSKFITRQRFVPSLVQVESRGLNRRVVDVSGTLVLMPYRSILVPASLLLPETLPIRATISIGVNGDFGAGVIELVAVKFHNLPALPNFIRAANGLAFGVVPHLLEPIWSYLPEFIGDDFYKRKRERTFATRHPNSHVPILDAAKDVVADTATGVMDYGVDTVHNLWDGVNYLYHNFMEAAGYGVGRAHAYTSAATNLASNVAASTYNTAANVASSTINTAANVANTAAGYAAGTASMAYDAAATTANKTYDAAASAADSAYNTAATAAGTAYETGRNTVQAGKETAEYAKDRTAVAVDKGVTRAELAAEDARRGYEMGKKKPVDVPVVTSRAPAGYAAY